ncbi:TPA: hypothetical protein U1C85_001746 [Streptococcus suis]|nr:hypothetical protein [Streptococcus suis]
MDAKKLFEEIKTNKIQYAIQSSDGNIYCNKDTNNIMDIFGIENEGKHIYGVYTDIVDNAFLQFDNRNADDELILTIIEELLKLGKPIDRRTLPNDFEATFHFGFVELSGLE